MARFLTTALLCISCLGCFSASAASHYVYILTGQSNSLGAVKGSPATPEQLARYASDALLWSGNMERDSGKPFDPAPSWGKVQPQLPRYNGSLCMGPEYGFAHMMQRHKWHSSASQSVCVIKASLDGGGNTFWLPGKPAYATLSATVQSGLAALEGKAHVQALLYLQGESDKGEEITQAPARLLSLKSRLQKLVKQGLKYAVVGQCASWFDKDAKDAKGNTTAQLMLELSQKKKEVAFVRTRDLTKITSGDNMGVHYDGISQITIGARFAYAVAVMEKLPLGFVRGDDPDAALDAPAAWWGNKAPKADDVITWDISSYRGSDKLRSALSVAGLEVDDPAAGAVTLQAAAHKAALSVGARGITLREGDLSLNCTLVTSADQTWRLAAGRSLKVSSLSGSGTITIDAPADATLELQLKAAPAQAWRLPQDMPQVRATIGGKPARFVKRGDVYMLEVE